ncbi:hypothetical protein [Streptosporangium sp. NPDC000509]|uniref:hypothetical protein n=1 Tax=Streptosporangium sp. NPDC000509 TaxID=3366186 RepID=UPI0036806E17
MKLRSITPTVLEGDAVAIISESFLPMLYWRNVPVLRRRSRELTSLERFVLEMGLALGTIDPTDFSAVTSLPPSVLAGAAWQLVADGVLTPDGTGYRVDPGRSVEALTQQSVHRLVRSTADFVLLPRTGDLLVVASEKNSWLRELERKQLTADLRAPVPPELKGYGRAAYLGMRVREGAAGTHGSGVADVPIPDHGDVPLVEDLKGGPGQPVLPGLCPAYRCSAVVRTDPDAGHVADVTLTGSRRRSGKDGEQVEVSVRLDGADGLLGRWLALADHLGDPVAQRAAWRELGLVPERDGPPPRMRRRGPSAWELLLEGETARMIGDRGRMLAEPMGLAVQGEEAVAEVSCWFFPADDDARLLFARDDVVTSVMSAHDPAGELERACAEAGRRYGTTLDEESVRERIWALGHYALAYELRRRKDFAYD